MSRQTKLTVHERDRFTCIGCGETFSDLSHLDVDHIIPRGAGGPNTLQNKATECRRCHEAKHGERPHAPTVRFQSTGDMPDNDFKMFLHFWNHQVPALSALAMDHRIVPKFNLKDTASEDAAWHIPIGDLRQLDKVLAEMDGVEYAPMSISHYM